MTVFPVFLSVVFVVRNQAHRIEDVLRRASAELGPYVNDYEFIIIDNGSDDDSVTELKQLTHESGLPNLQVYALTREVDSDTAAWAGLDNALGDFVAVVDPLSDDTSFIPEMLGKAIAGADVVFAANTQRPQQTIPYRLAHFAFTAAYKGISGVHLAKEAPPFRLLGRRVINFIRQHAQPAISYRHLPATGGFARVNLKYSGTCKEAPRKRLIDSIDRGIRLMVSTTRLPMRLVTFLSLFGAAANLIYALYVVAVGLFANDVAPGWISLSLQQSGMFFLLSLVLLVLGEYVLNMASLSNEGPLYFVGQEFTSARLTRREKLNIEEVEFGTTPLRRMELSANAS